MFRLRGLASLSVAFPDSKNSPMSLSCTDWHTSRMSLPLKPSASLASSDSSTSGAMLRFEMYSFSMLLRV